MCIKDFLMVKQYYCVYIDDGLILARNQEIIHKILEILKAKFEVTIDNVVYFLSLEIKRNSSTKTIMIKARVKSST